MYCPEVNVIAEAESVQSALVEIAKHNPDLVLLDIKMQDGTGFDLLGKFDPAPFKVVFITAFDQFAVDAFKFSALDYLLKPVNPDELVKAMKKAQEKVAASELEVRIKTFISNINNFQRETKKIVLKTQESVHIIAVSEIVRCEADRNYTKFYLGGGKSLLVTGSLKEYDDMLANSGFFRAHHSYLVNLDFIDHFRKNKMLLVMKDQSEVPVATRKKEMLLELLEKI
jgi:two-component system, LytTR family, response regulator